MKEDEDKEYPTCNENVRNEIRVNHNNMFLVIISRFLVDKTMLYDA